MKKIMIVAMMFCCVLLAACGGQADKAENTGEYLTENYSVAGDTVEIYGLGSPEAIVITDSEDVKALQESVDFGSWKYIDPQSGETYQGIENIFVKFNDSTTVAMYTETPYGLLGQGVPDAELGNLENTDAYYTFPQEFHDITLQMMEKYKK